MEEPRPQNQKDLTRTKIFLAVLALIGLAFIVWAAWLRPSEDQPVSTFEECVAAGNPVQESYPEVCVTPDGQRFPKSDQQVEDLPY